MTKKKLKVNGTSKEVISLIAKGKLIKEIREKYNEDIEYALFVKQLSWFKATHPLILFTDSRVIVYNIKLLDIKKQTISSKNQVGVIDWGRIENFQIMNLPREMYSKVLNVCIVQGDNQINLGKFNESEYSFERLQHEIMKGLSPYLKEYYRDMLKSQSLSELDLEDIVADTFTSNSNSLSINIDKSVNINIQDSVVSRSSLGLGEHTSRAEHAPPPPATGYDPKAEKKRIKAELKKAKKEGKE